MNKTIRAFSALTIFFFVLASCAPRPTLIEEESPVSVAGNLFKYEPQAEDYDPDEVLTWKKLGTYGDVDIFKVRGLGVLLGEPQLFTQEEQSTIEKKIAQYKTIIRAHPDINFHAFYLELIENSAFHPVNGEYKHADAGRSYDFFVENKPKRLKFDSLRLTSFEDQLKYYYRTDHHWNVYGVLQGYQQIYQLLAESYTDISPMLTTGEVFSFPDIDFLGRWAKLLNHSAKTESFSVYLANLPPYRIYDRDGNEIDYNNRTEYLSGSYSREKFADHYVEFYGADVDFLEYVSDNGSERNLLIIGDSFTNAIEPLLAAHYHHTYCVDIRKFPDYKFSFSDFVAQYDVDDVLILGGSSVVFYTWRWSIQP